MVRINLINPKNLADQHLLAEHVEILMLFTSALKYDKDKVPNDFRLGKGHINFFKNKLEYLKQRFLNIQEEMRERGYMTDANIQNYTFEKEQLGNFSPSQQDFKVIKDRLLEKINEKPDWYTYYGEKLEMGDWFVMINNSE